MSGVDVEAFHGIYVICLPSERLFEIELAVHQCLVVPLATLL
jgi:hypothetical protein